MSAADFSEPTVAFEAALDGIVFEQIREVVRRNDIADRDHFDVLAHQALFDQRPEDQATDAAEPIDCNFHCHIFLSFFNKMFSKTDGTI